MQRTALPLLAGVRIWRTLLILTILLVVLVVLGLGIGSRTIDLSQLRSDPIARTVFFRLRLPRVLMAALIGA
jgi:ABC-type enterobactin transport system permease subunit